MNRWLAFVCFMLPYAIFCIVLMCAVCGRMNHRGERS
jgi:hypothetical protein